MILRITTLLTLCASLTAGAVQTGTTSWYGQECAGLPMANGKPFNPRKMTCASWFYPLGSKLRVQYGNRFVVVSVTDRGPSRALVNSGRVLDLSRQAYCLLAKPETGTIKVRITRIK